MSNEAFTGPGDGSNWVVPSVGPDDLLDFHNPPDPPFPERREGFSEGRSFLDGNGVRWCLPKLGPEAYDQIPAIRDYVTNAATALEEGEIVESEHPPVRQYIDASQLLRQLLKANYLNSDLAIEMVIFSCNLALVMNPSREDPLVQALASIDDHIAAFYAFFHADRNGLNRKDAVALAECPVTDTDLPGWHEHDGPIFDN